MKTIEKSQIDFKRMAEIWHVSAAHSNNRHERLLYTCRWLKKETPDVSELAIYKILERWIAGVYL